MIEFLSFPSLPGHPFLSRKPQRKVQQERGFSMSLWNKRHFRKTASLVYCFMDLLSSSAGSSQDPARINITLASHAARIGMYQPSHSSRSRQRAGFVGCKPSNGAKTSLTLDFLRSSTRMLWRASVWLLQLPSSEWRLRPSPLDQKRLKYVVREPWRM